MLEYRGALYNSLSIVIVFEKVIFILIDSESHYFVEKSP